MNRKGNIKMTSIKGRQYISTYIGSKKKVIIDIKTNISRYLPANQDKLSENPTEKKANPEETS